MSAVRLVAALILGLSLSATSDTLSGSVALHAQLDHLVIGIRSLPEGIAEFERRTGVKAQIGGKHPGRGTENALVSIGGGSYLEIIAPEANATLAARDERMRDLAHLKVITWAIGVSNADEAIAALKAAGFSATTPQPGARVTPAGERLEWRTFGLEDRTIAVAPFFIEWAATTKHPSTTAPGGCSLETFRVRDPAAERLAGSLKALGVTSLAVGSGEPSVEVTLKCGTKTATLK